MPAETNLQRQAPHLLVVDDEVSLREFLCLMLEGEGYQVDSAADGAQALQRLEQQAYDLVLTDLRMPGTDGLELLRQVQRLRTDTLVVLMTAYATAEQAVEAMKQGAYDYLIKPFKNDELRLVIRKALGHQALRQENQRLRQVLDQRHRFDQLVGKSPAMCQLYQLIERVAPTSASVLITGESGTGKELVARAIHEHSPRAPGSFVAVNCGAIPEQLLETELFGHEKGAFTGAVHKKNGLFDQASGGTLFLDEVAELPPHMQVKLLRALQERRIRPVGAADEHAVDVRVVAATNQDVASRVEQGSFRQDLFYRLNVVHLQLPPLRQRPEDIPLLVEALCQKLAPQRKIAVAPELMRHLLDYDWPGNVRELENVLERCLILDSAEVLGVQCLPPDLCGRSQSPPLVRLPPEGLQLEDYLQQVERQLLDQALQRCQGVRSRAARLLGLSFRSLRYRLQKLGL
ncbi:MAG: sigma-54-dependent transcriptional regulator [Desulfuromonas sp.]|uniref:sigma-54-dependent transcriptional regulator n=1 Tax=Desulfuromonas thiophila TaxID=57664 RepID=UPI0024A7A4E9|nr:sigma-54 dependent transcriptional regulator [Desulfuromonas thiophila]MDD3800762.1 sigma-54 dependent transcriptional regulator [Desulfuromonas thiophila]